MVGTASEDVQELTAKAGHAKARFGATVHLAAPLVILCVYISQQMGLEKARAGRRLLERREFYLYNSDASRSGPCFCNPTCGQERRENIAPFGPKPN